METNQFLNFAEVDVPTLNYLEPGKYLVKVTDVKLEQVKDKKGTSEGAIKPVLKVTFTTKDDKSYTETFYLTGENTDKSRKALGRLQYLYDAVFKEKITESFTNYDEMAEFFKIKLKKATKIKLVVNGEEQEDGKVYSRLGFSDFIFAGAEEFVEGPFVKDSPEWKKAVTKKKMTTAGSLVANTSVPVLNPTAGAAAAVPWDN